MYRLLSIRSAQHHFGLHRDMHTTLDKVAEYLIRYRDDLGVFFFSGHANRDQLILEDQAVQGEGIAGLLAQCPKLKLVVLNGCSTAGQMQRLLKLPNQPVVIGTSAPVNDFSATKFSISFFQTLSEQRATIQQAFVAGLAAAELVLGTSVKIAESRGPKTSTDASGPIWQLDVNPGSADNLQWKLPAARINAAISDVEPNEYFLRELPEQLKARDPWATDEDAEPSSRRSVSRSKS